MKRADERPWYFYLVYAGTIWGDIWGWLFLSSLRIIPAKATFQTPDGRSTYRRWSTLGKRLYMIDGGLWVVFREGTWVSKRLRFSGGCIGNGGWLRNPGDFSTVDIKPKFREAIHQEQFQVMQFYTLLITLFNYFVCGSNLWAFAVMPFAGGIAYICAMFVALLRGEDPYRDNIMEESAYRQAAGFNAQSPGPHEIARRYAERQLGL